MGVFAQGQGPVEGQQQAGSQQRYVETARHPGIAEQALVGVVGAAGRGRGGLLGQQHIVGQAPPNVAQNAVAGLHSGQSGRAGGVGGGQALEAGALAQVGLLNFQRRGGGVNSQNVVIVLHGRRTVKPENTVPARHQYATCLYPIARCTQGFRPGTRARRTAAFTSHGLLLRKRMRR